MVRFTMDMNRILSAYDQRFDVLVQEVTVQMVVMIADKTPEDTGRTRGNYIISPSGESLTDFDPYKFDPGGTFTFPYAQNAVKEIKAGGIVRIINNTPYAMDLEYGTSRQAPSGMARVAVFEFQPIVDKIAKGLSNVRVN